MQAETHNLGGDFMFVPRPGVRVTGITGSCLQLEADHGMSFLVVPMDATAAYVLIAPGDRDEVVYAMHPYPVLAAAPYIVVHNLTPLSQQEGVTVLAPPSGKLFIGSVKAHDTGLNILMLRDAATSDDLRSYLEGHKPFEPLTTEDLAGLRMLWSAVESALILPPPSLGIVTIASIFTAGISFAQNFPNITKWSLDTERAPNPLWTKDSDMGLLYQELSDMETVLGEREWKGASAEGKPSPLAELSPELKATLEELRKKVERQRETDGPQAE